jgi:O-succinylbenzoic acid--CoA ligase
MQLPEHTRCIMAVPASHVTGLVANIITTLSTAGTLTIMPQFKADEFLRLAEQEHCQFTVLVPAMYQLCLMQPDHERYDLSDWIVGGYGGAPMPVSTIDALGKWLPSLGLMNAYGATESTSPATLMPAPLTRAHADSVGVALPCAELKVIDDKGSTLAPGQVGEICIAGPMVVPGYWDNPAATDSEFVDGYWHSGDLGRIDEQGFVYVMDRKKDMLNRGGHKIYSVEVENVLMSVDSVHEAAVIGKPCPVLGERVHAVVCADPQRVRSEKLHLVCAEHLADYKVPESIHIQTDPLPRNANGKILKRLLRERLQALESGPD